MPKSRKHLYWRTLLVITLLLVIAAGALINWRLQSARHLEQIVAAHGGKVEYTQITYIPDWLISRLSKKSKSSLRQFENRLWKPAWLKFNDYLSSEGPLTDEKWSEVHAALRPYRHRIVYIDFAGSSVGNDTVETLLEYSDLQNLDLTRTWVDDGCIKHISVIPKLSCLHLNEDALTAGGHEQLVKLREQRFFIVAW